MLNLRQRRQLFLDLGQRVRDRQAAPDKDLVGLAHRNLCLLGYAVPFHSHLVGSSGLGWVAVHDHVWGHILNNFGTASNHRHGPDPAELVYRRQSAHHRMILHRHMPREGCHIRHDDVIAQPHVMRDVSVGEDMIVRPYHRYLAIARGTVDSHAFAEGVVLTYLCSRHAALPFQILGLEPNASERIDDIPLPQPRVAIDYHVRMQPAIRPEFHVFPDDAIRPYFATRANLRFRVDNRCWVHHIAFLFRTAYHSLPASRRGPALKIPRA